MSATKANAPVRVLFVCLGNICRSPSAEAMFNAKLVENNLTSQFVVESAGTLDYHVGEPPDPRAIRFGKQRGLDLTLLRGRQINADDFTRFDYILVMDSQNLKDVLAVAPSNSTAHVAKLLSYGSNINVEDVPDPYFGGDDGFNHVLDLLDDALDGFLEVAI